MEKTKILVFFLGMLLLLSVLYIYMYKTGEIPVTPEVDETENTEEVEIIEITESEDIETVPPVDESLEKEETEGEITVSAESLSDGQKQLLETFGVDTDNIVITPEMIACAEEKVGKTRLQEIQAGDTPSFFEGMALIGCYE